MAEQSRRERVASFYRGPTFLTEKTASSASQYAFHGPDVVAACVVRVDLNGYSKWALERPIAARVALLNEYFTRVVPLVEQNRGIFFRDEGDCVVALFSQYFTPGLTYEEVLRFARTAVANRYGADAFSAKAVIAKGDDVAIFQKFHEQNTPDWSAEGQPFVTAARIEAAIDSGPRVCIPEAEYDQHFASSTPSPASGERYFWRLKRESLQIAGLGAKPNGWVPVVYLEHLEKGEVA
ncbi:MAG TPA: hypothetical protein VJV79_37905 [Polyangiaceae bacterium]|nr:hypothetical protein [Polyangiaceae bacterium]